MNVNISVVGIGYVGLVCATGFAEIGNDVVCVDTDADKIERLKEGIIPIYEPGLEEILKENIASGSITFSNDIRDAMAKTSICFIAVGTPMTEDGSADTRHVLDVADSIGRHMQKHMFVVNKSTVPIGTGDKIRERIATRLRERGSDLTFDVISNPEFLKEGMAFNDFMKPDRVVIGVDDERALEIMQELYNPVTQTAGNLIVMDIRSAEMTKYAANAMLATKISFINEMANICERVGADVNKVRVGISSDSRIGYQFLYPGCGYGGSCFPKDVRALIRTADDHGYPADILKSVDAVNRRQKGVVLEKVFRRFGKDLSGRIFAVWGLAFKPDTDDMRESPAIEVITRLCECGATVQAYDPKATEHARNYYFKDNPGVTFHRSKYTALQDAEAMILLTEWKEFRNPDFEELLNVMRSPVIIDGRNQYNRKKMKDLGIEYHQIGVPSDYEG